MKKTTGWNLGRTAVLGRWIGALGATAALAMGCGPSEGACTTNLSTTGPLVVDLDGRAAECQGLSDNLSTNVDMDLVVGTTILGLEFDDLVAGETGAFDPLVVVDDRSEQWRAHCPMTIRRHANIGGSIWEIEGDVTCGPLAADFGNDTDEPLTVGTFSVTMWHSRYDY